VRVFVSYSFRESNQWVEDYVIPLLECFGHVPVTGRLLDTGGLDEEVKSKILECRRVLCFVTRARERNGEPGVYDPPDWVRDEMAMARGAERQTLEFRENGVSYGGAAGYHAYVPFDSAELPKLLLELSRRLSEWPVGPLQLRLTVPEGMREEVQQAANAKTLRACCMAIDETGHERSKEELTVRVRDGQLIVPFWIKPDPNLSIDIEVTLGVKRLACRGISPAVCIAKLEPT
jgi:hypothetical protein